MMGVAGDFNQNLFSWIQFWWVSIPLIALSKTTMFGCFPFARWGDLGEDGRDPVHPLATLPRLDHHPGRFRGMDHCLARGCEGDHGPPGSPNGVWPYKFRSLDAEGEYLFGLTPEATNAAKVTVYYPNAIAASITTKLRWATLMSQVLSVLWVTLRALLSLTLRVWMPRPIPLGLMSLAHVALIILPWRQLHWLLC